MTTTPMINNKREVRGWMLYDFANSAFSTTVITVFLGPYLTSLIESQVGSKGTFSLLGIPIGAESFFTYCVSISVLLQVFVLPVLGAIADFAQALGNGLLEVERPGFHGRQSCPEYPGSDRAGEGAHAFNSHRERGERTRRRGNSLADLVQIDIGDIA